MTDKSCTQPNPDLYRPCVGLMLLNAEGHIFAGQRFDSQVEAWQMPQGGIDPGERPEEAAFRELGEETGILSEHAHILATSESWIYYDLPMHLRKRLWGGRFRGQRQKWFALRFTGQDSDINIATRHPEFKEWRWLDARNLLRLIVPFKRDTYHTVFTEFAEYLG